MSWNHSFNIEEYCKTMTPHNQAIVHQFVREKQLSGVRESTIKTELHVLQSVFRYLGNDVELDKITTEQVEDWYLWYRETPTKHTGNKPKPLSLQTQIMNLRQIMVSIHGEDETRKMFRRIKVPRRHAVTVKEEELLTDEEIKRMIEGANNERDRAIVSVLYASGCRVGELCNLRVKDVTFARVGASLHLNGKTGERDVDLFIGVPELKRWLNVHPMRSNPDAPLFICKTKTGRLKPQPLAEMGVWRMLERLSASVGIPENKRHNPHSFRHKRATDLADHLTTADLRQMFGWSEMSNTPNVYVHSSRGKVKRKLAEIAGVKIPESVAPSSMVHVCPVCGAVNGATDTWCNNCGATLEEHLSRTEQQTEEFMLQKMQERGVGKKQDK